MNDTTLQTVTEVKLPIPQDLSPEQQNELAAKFGGWRPLIEELYRTELNLKNQALNQQAKVLSPASIEQIPVAEQQHVELGKVIAAMKEQRMAITRPFDKLNARLMEPEKMVEDLRKQLADKIVVVKRNYEQIQQAKKQKDAEVQQIILTIKNHLATKDQEYRSRISIQCGAAFAYALDNNIAVDKIQEFVDKCSKKLGDADFQAEKPALNPRHVSPEEIEELFVEHWRSNPHAYTQIYQNELASKFVDYAVAVNNKAEALAQAAKDEAEKQAKLQAEKDQKDLAAKMESAAQPMEQPTVGAPIRALKKSYELDMPDDENTAKVICAQYWANIHLTRTKTRASWLKLSITQMGKALADVKNDDNAFVPQGVTFKEVSKL